MDFCEPTHTTLEFCGHRGHCGGVAPPASYLGHEQPGSAVEAEAGAGWRPRTVTGLKIPRLCKSGSQMVFRKVRADGQVLSGTNEFALEARAWDPRW